MSVAEDRRVKLTKKILKESLIEIMHTKSINEISIKKVCEVADINRSTFYHHYQSPQELYDEIIDDIALEINGILEKSKGKNLTQSATITELLTYVEDNRELFLVILSEKGNISIGERLNKIIGRFIGANKNSELARYCAQFISAGVANILWIWLNNETRLPPKDVAGLITTIMNHGVRRAVMFSTGGQELFM